MNYEEQRSVKNYNLKSLFPFDPTLQVEKQSTYILDTEKIIMNIIYVKRNMKIRVYINSSLNHDDKRLEKIIFKERLKYFINNLNI